MRLKSTLEQKRLKEVLHYDPSLGHWTRVGGHRLDLAGTNAGNIDTKHNGISYLRICVDGRRYYAHQLAVFYMLGIWPEPLPDHKDGNGLNNVWSNIRIATHSQNGANSKMKSNNSSGFKGVARKGKRWRAYIAPNGKQKYLGVFDTAEKAAIAYKIAALSIFGEFARL